MYSILDHLQYFSALIEDNELLLVGGAVRAYLNELNTCYDFDFVTKRNIQDVANLLRENGYKVNDQAFRFGIIHTTMKGLNIEFAAMRKDVHCDGRHAIVQFTDSIEEDAMRRDFTMNAIYLDTNGRFIDYVGGLEDFTKKRLRFIGVPDLRIKEDYLRILRFIRFFANLDGAHYDCDLLPVIQRNVQSLSMLSKERVTIELQKTLIGVNAIKAIKLAKDLGVFNALFKDVDIATNIKLPINFAITECDWPFLLLFERPSLGVLKSALSFTKAQLRRLDILLNNSIEDERDHYAFVYYHGKDLYEIAVLYYSLKHNKDYKVLNMPDSAMPVKAADLIQIGFKGAEISAVLKQLENDWINSKFAFTKNQLLCIRLDF